jgi:hypothetical protein
MILSENHSLAGYVGEQKKREGKLWTTLLKKLSTLFTKKALGAAINLTQLTSGRDIENENNGGKRNVQIYRGLIPEEALKETG